MAAKDIVAGVGTRYGVVFLLDSATGLPLPSAASAAPYTGIEITGIKSAAAQDPAPRRITHMGNDRAYAQDSLPATTLETFRFTTSKTNLTLDAYLEGVKVRSYTNFEARAANNANRGNEPLMMAMFYRQALDADPDSGTYGKLRQYNVRIYPSTQMSPITDEYAQAETDKTYEGTPSNASYTPWNEDINSTNWGTGDGAHIEGVTALQPRWNFYRGNGTLTGFALSDAPYSSSHVLVWADGTLVSPSAVDTTNPAFTLSVAPGVDKLVAALLQKA